MQYKNKFFEINVPDSILDFRAIPQATQIITIAYVVLSVSLLLSRRIALMYSEPTVTIDDIYNPFLQLMPHELYKNPLSLLTSNLVDTSIVKFCINILNLLLGGSYIEKNWNSSKELFRFVIVVGTITNMITVIITVILSFVLNSISLDIPIDGNYTMIIGFPIIYKQLLPETTIIYIFKPIDKNFRFKLLPIFIMCTMTLIQFIWFHHFAELLSIWVSFITAWIYLRFYQLLPSTMFNDTSELIRGDASDTFQLIYFFPDQIKPILRPIFNWFYDLICVKLRLIQPFELDDIDKGNDLAQKKGAKPITNSTEERRRQLALQVLQERMS